MTSYRTSRRAFLASVGGAVGLQILLRNLEAAAEGAGSPPRFLMAHWPCGTARVRFLPTGDRTGFQISPILAPFEAAGLREDLIVLYGLRHTARTPGGGGEHGLVLATTGCDSPGTRANGGEGDDSVAGGPSFDQVFLKNVAALQRPGIGFANAICDARVDSFETSSQCLSYSYQRRQVEAAFMGGTLTENVPLLPVLAPVDLYATLFSSFIPGAGLQSAATRALRTRKSVLDSALRELARLHELAPSSQRDKIEIHTEAVRQVERELQTKLDEADRVRETCALPSVPSPDIRGKSGSRFDYGVGQEKAVEPDDPMLEQTGKLHLSLIRAAFQCDLLRVATFQWCPSSNHVAFQGMFPNDPAGAYMHHPLTHRVGNASFYTGPAPTMSLEDAGIYEFVCRVQTWFNQKTADALVEFKNAKDGFGNSLLDYTIVPFITEVGNPTHVRSGIPALIIGGKKLGMLGGQYLEFAPDVAHNALWLSVAQAYFPEGNALEALKAETFISSTGTATAPIPGLWQRPI